MNTHFPALITLAFAVCLYLFPTSTHAALSEWQQGVTLHLNNQSKADITASLEQLAKTGASHVALSPGYLTASKVSSNVDRKPGTPSDEILIFTIQKAHELGFSVMLKPHVDIAGGSWRAFLRPAEPAKFFENYSRMMFHHADIAQQYGVEQLAVGAELYTLTTDLQYEQAWRTLIAAIRGRYSGALTYSANADYQYDESKLPFWDALDYAGLSMYIEVADTTTPSVASIKERWKKIEEGYVYPFHQRVGKPLIFTEIGYRSVDGAGMRPENYSFTATVDTQEQADLYTAFFEYWKDRPYIKGVNFWEWEPQVTAGGLTDKNYTPQNKPAAAVLTRYFTETAGESGSVIPEGPEVLPAPQTLITKITMPETYSVDTLAIGKKIYADRTYQITTLPAGFSGYELISTRNEHKQVTQENFLSFQLRESASVYVAFDYRATRIPAWLQGWQATQAVIKTSDTTFRLYQKYFPAGVVTLGGNAAFPQTGARSMYFVLATPGAEDDVEVQEPVVIVPTEPVPPALPAIPSTGGLEVEYPKNNTEVSGEKKIKVYISDLTPDQYDVSYSVDGREEEEMNYGTHDKYKQVKVDFEKEWTWNGSGPYQVVFTARDKQGNILDTETLTLYVER